MVVVFDTFHVQTGILRPHSSTDEVIVDVRLMLGQHSVARWVVPKADQMWFLNDSRDGRAEAAAKFVARKLGQLLGADEYGTVQDGGL